MNNICVVIAAWLNASQTELALERTGLPGGGGGVKCNFGPVYWILPLSHNVTVFFQISRQIESQIIKINVS